MTAPLLTRTTIGQLVYRKLPQVDLARLVADLDVALRGCDAGAIRRALERDGVALLDVGASRVGVALMRRLDPSGAAAITVTVGFGPGEGDESLARRRSVLARLIAQRIATRFPPLETVWSETDALAEPALFDRLRAALAERRAEQAAQRAARARDRHAVARAGIEAGDIARLFTRFESALDARRSGAQPAFAGGVAMALEAGPAEEAAPAPQPPRLRLAAHLIDITLMVIALPVGVAMMIYSLSRGADVNKSARAMALTGVAIATLYAAGRPEVIGALGA